MSTYDELNQQKIELERQIEVLMKDVRPLKKKLADVTEEMYRLACDGMRDKPVWKLSVNLGKTQDEARYAKKQILCTEATFEEMMDIAAAYFTENGIIGWKLSSYLDWGQFHYSDGLDGGPVLGSFEITKGLPRMTSDEEES